MNKAEAHLLYAHVYAVTCYIVIVLQERAVARADVEEVDEDGEQESDDSEAQNSQELLDHLKEDLEENGGRYSDSFIIDFYKKKLSSMPCQNQGYVLDGFPKTYEQAMLLFSGNFKLSPSLLYNKSTFPYLDLLNGDETNIISCGSSVACTCAHVLDCLPTH